MTIENAITKPIKPHRRMARVPKGLTRRMLLTCDMPVDRVEQERMFGFSA